MKEIIIAIIASGIFTTLLTWVLGRIDSKKNKKNKDTAETQKMIKDLDTKLDTVSQNRDNQIEDLRGGLRQLLYGTIKTRCIEYIAKGFICSGDLEDLLRDWEMYHSNLHGNGYLDKLMEEVKKLPIKD